MKFIEPTPHTLPAKPLYPHTLQTPFKTHYHLLHPQPHLNSSALTNHLHPHSTRCHYQSAEAESGRLGHYLGRWRQSIPADRDTKRNINWPRMFCGLVWKNHCSPFFVTDIITKGCKKWTVPTDKLSELLCFPVWSRGILTLQMAISISNPPLLPLS